MTTRTFQLTAALFIGALLFGMAPTTAQAQTEGATLTDGDAEFILFGGETEDLPTDPEEGSSSNATLEFTTSGDEHYYETWWYYRMDGDTQEYTLHSPTSRTVTTNTASYTFDVDTDVEAELDMILTSPSTGLATLAQTITIHNNSVSDATLSFFHYLDLDLGNSSSDDEADWVSDTAMNIWDTTNTVAAQFVGPNSDLYEVMEYSDLQSMLTDTALDDFTDNGLPFGPEDYTGGYQWDLVIPAGESWALPIAIAVEEGTVTSPTAEVITEDCSDGFDNDGDGDADCADTDCNCDLDGDGYDDVALGGDDCDDGDPAINPGAVEVQDGVDQDCDGMVDEGALPAGAVLITEIQKNPNMVADDQGEWFEVLNNTAFDVNLYGFEVSDQGTDSFTVDQDVWLAPGAYAVLTRDGDSAANGGVTADYDYANGLTLANGDDELVLTLDGDVIDDVFYADPAWPDTDGAAMSLSVDAYDGALNDDHTNWCDAQAAYGDGDLGTPGTVNPSCCADADGDGYHDISCGGDDCDDADAAVNPGAGEVACDGVDTDCDGALHAEETDADGDGYTECDGDCDDADPSIGPGAPEIRCDLIDNDCDGAQHPEDVDDDGDGYTECDGDCDDADVAMNLDDADSDGSTSCTGDCDDNNAAMNLLDNDGDGVSSCAGDCDDFDQTTYPGALELCDGFDNDCDPATDELVDDDGDTFAECDGDCDDTDVDINPDAEEICDGVDNDCDPATDEDVDDDGDGYTDCEDDCDDGDVDTYPGATELCDGIDNDCDGTITTEEADVDGDEVMECDGDCDDDDPDTYPGAPELCDQLDNDCDDEIDEEVDEDIDGDGFNACQGDCDNDDDTIYPGADELCDGLDNDCDETLPEDEEDLDGDGWLACEECDDDDETIHPDADEDCEDGIDNNCDGLIDDEDEDACGETGDDDDDTGADDDDDDLGGGGCDCDAAGGRSASPIALTLLFGLALIRRRR